MFISLSRLSRLIFLIFVVTFDSSKSQGIWTKNGCRVDLCFILDRSNSIGIDNWQKIIRFTEDFVVDLTVTDQATQVGLVTFASFGELIFPLDEYNENKSGLIQALKSAEYYGTGTSIDDGLSISRTECFVKGNRQDAPDVAVLMTDGESRFLEADYEARLLRENGISIVVIGIGSRIDQDLLFAIADSEQNLFLINDFNKLVQDTSLILGRSCSAVESCSGGQIDGWQQSDFPILLDCPRLSNPIIDEDIFQFECYINYSIPLSNEARFLVQFLHDGVPNDQYSVVLTPPNITATLHEYYIRGHMGKYLSCQVKTYWSTSPVSVSPAVVSRSYWTGITFSHEVVTVYETDNDDNTEYDNSAVDYVFSSLPILCPRDNNKCDLLLKITSTGSVAVYQSQKNGIIRCSYQLSKDDWKSSESWAYDKDRPLKVVAVRKLVPQNVSYGSIMMRTEPLLTTLTTDLPGIAPGTEYSPWSGYILPDIKVQMYGGNKRGLCRSFGDPHILTFDGRNYNLFESGGDGIYFLFISSKAKLKIQIHIYNDIILGVVVYDGGERTIVTTSNKQPLKCDNQKKPKRTTVTSDGSDTYFIRTSSGVMVEVFHGGYYLNIFIEVPPRIYKDTAGLCGSFDGDASNDFTVFDTDYTEIDFKNHYRIGNGDDNYFNCSNLTFEPPEDFCQCDGTVSEGEISDTTVCGLDDKLLDHLIPSFPVTLLIPRFVLTNNRKRPRTKRDVDDELYTDHVVDYEPPTVSDHYTPYPGPPPWGTYGITEEMARTKCLDTLSGSQSYKVCKSIVNEQQIQNILTNCVFDIQATGDVSFVMDTVSSLKASCRVNMLNEAANYVTDPEDPLSDPSFATIFFSFLNVTCINDCSGHGVCNKGSCLCHSGYLGEDCSLLSGTPPSNVQYLEPMFCDRAERPCRSVRLQAENIVTTNDVFCKLTIKHDNGSLYEVIHKGIPQGFGVVTCILPDIEHFTYHISLSNDGKIFKESDPSDPERIIGDSTQMWDECVEQNVFKSQTDTCVKKGKCYERKSGSVICPTEEQYGSWSKFGPCSKSCDYGIQMRTRICLKSICDGDLVQTLVCNTVHCSIKPEEANNGVLMSIYGLSIDQVAQIESPIINSTLELLNDYSRNNSAELCDSIQLRRNDKGNIMSNIFLPGDIKIASGYPEVVSEDVVSIRWLAVVYVPRVEKVCIVDKDPVRRDVQGDSRNVNGEYLRKALTGLDDVISQLLDDGVSIKFEVPNSNQPSPPSVDIVLVASSVIAVCVITVIIITVALYCTKWRRSNQVF